MSLGFANKVTIFRILAVPIFIASILYYNPQRDFLRFISLGIFSLAVLSDVIDCYIARTRREKTKAGAILDPLADKLLLISAFISLYLISNFPAGIKFPLWVALIAISRDVIILLGAVVTFIIKQNINISPTRWGKLTTTFQMVSVITVLMQWRISSLFWSIAVFFTIISGVDYIRRGFKILYGVDNSSNTK